MNPSLLLSVVFVLVIHCPMLAEQPPPAYGLTAYRPQHGNGYHPFARTAVSDDLEEHRHFGPGIRVNGANEVDPEEEDDLVELVVTRPSDSATFVLERDDPSLSVWRTRGGLAQTEVAFTDTRSTRLVFGGAQQITLWVEWTGAAPAYPALSLVDLESDDVVDRIVFHAFTGLVVALGGEDQVPDLPVDRNHGTFRVATALYDLGWDVLMRDEDEVGPDGSGLVYDEIVNAIRNRSVQELAIFGYSHGGGSTHDLCALLDLHGPTLSTFSVNFTSYVDGIRNSSDVDIRAETRRPPASRFHANHYQHGSWADGFLDGGRVAGSVPPPDGLDVESVSWGMEASHFEIDDFDEVRGLIHAALTDRVSR